MYNQSVTVFFPCYNDAKSIGGLVTDVYKTLTHLVKDWEILVVNDGSTDGSNKILDALTRHIPHVRIITHSENKGYGAALRSGFAAAKKDLVFYTDGDGQYDPKELAILLPLMTKDIDFVNGIKTARKDPTYRIMLGNWYSMIARWMFWLPIYDVDCDFRLIRRSILKKLVLTTNSGAICVELVKKAELAGARLRQVSIHHYERRFGGSQFFRISHLLTTLREIIILWLQVMILFRITGQSRNRKYLA